MAVPLVASGFRRSLRPQPSYAGKVRSHKGSVMNGRRRDGTFGYLFIPILLDGDQPPIVNV